MREKEIKMKKLFLATLMISASFTGQADDCFCLHDGGPMPKQFCQGECYPIEEVEEKSDNCVCKMNTVEIDGKIYSTYGHSCGGGDGCSTVFDTILDSFHEKYPDVPEEFYFPKKENWDSEEWWKTATVENLKNEIDKPDTTLKQKEEMLKYAIIGDRDDLVNIILNDNRLNIKSFKGQRNRSLICSAGPKTLPILLKYDVDINEICGGGNSKIMNAALGADPEEFELLLKYNASLNIKDNRGRSILQIATNCFPEAFCMSNAVENGKDPMTCLKETERLAIVQSLLRLGADVNAKDQSGRTPLIDTVSCGYAKIANELLDRGANINEEDNDGENPLLLAIAYDRVEIMQILLKKGANLNFRNRKDTSPLILAIYKENLNAVKLLIENGADVNLPGPHGMTPLMMAVDKGNIDILKLLLSNGADIDLKDNDGKGVLDYCNSTDESIIQTLKTAGAKV